MAKIIALFNNKGGVSKTTTTFHLGWKLAELGYKTLMIDTDPQCNLTGLCLNADKENKLTQFYEAQNPSTTVSQPTGCSPGLFSGIAPYVLFSSSLYIFRIWLYFI